MPHRRDSATQRHHPSPSLPASGLGKNGIGSSFSVKPSFFLSSQPSEPPCDPNQSALLGQIVSWHSSERSLGTMGADSISADIGPASACGRSSGDASASRTFCHSQDRRYDAPPQSFSRELLVRASAFDRLTERRWKAPYRHPE